jgi:hypothetical protein
MFFVTYFGILVVICRTVTGVNSKLIVQRVCLATYLSTVSICISYGQETNVDYDLDMKTPAVLVFQFPNELPLPSRIDVYKTGPELESDNSATPTNLSRRKPDYSITNKADVSELTSALTQAVSVSKVTNVPNHRGFKYHLLLYYEYNKTVMHFRAFEFTDIDTEWSYVRPRAIGGFGYFNSKVVKLLKQHAEKHATKGNGAP